MSPKPLVVMLSALLASGCSGAAPRERVVVAPTAPGEQVIAAPAAFATTQATTTPVAPVSVEPVERVESIAEATSPGARRPPQTPVLTPSTQPSVSSTAERFDALVLAMIGNEPPPPVEAFSSLRPEDRDIVRAVIDSLTSFRLALRNETSLVATKVAPLIDLSDRLEARIPLDVPTLALCRSVTQFGVYDAYEPARFTAGKETPVIVYCEVDHFRSNPAPDGRFETKLTYEATLYSDGESAISVINKKPTNIVDRCRNKRRDFFLADRLTLPGNLPVGRYVLKVTVIDQLANHVAEKTVPILIAPN